MGEQYWRGLCEQLFCPVGDYPKSLGDLSNPPNGVPPFVKRAADLQDPWGKEYIYQYLGARNTGSFDLSTTGPDGTVIETGTAEIDLIKRANPNPSG